MITTAFKPSIHGWPFGNSWTKSFIFEGTALDMGFCGGMCWTALKRFYAADLISRSTIKPSEGDSLYDEIWNSQLDSLATLGKIFNWQSSPDLSHATRKHSLGYRTQQEWPDIKSKLENDKPVTLTLVAHSNDFNPAHLQDSHRVVAYAFETENVVSGDEAPEGAHTKVTLWIYDPNEENDNNVNLTFFLGADRSRIRLRHSHEGNYFHGFFLDDKDRNYKYAEVTSLNVIDCIQAGIISRTRAVYDLSFSWGCRVIPYFNIIINDVSWNYNRGTNLAFDQFEPLGEDDKQCSSRNGNLLIKIQLPRELSRIRIRILDSPDFEKEIVVDATPSIKCLPYVRIRMNSPDPCISDSGIVDQDLFIHDATPDNNDINQLDISIFRWVKNFPGSVRVQNRAVDPSLQSTHVEVICTYRLGNVVVPIYANFEERNMAQPTSITGLLKIKVNNSVISSINLQAISSNGQKIFDGFTNNPSDYNSDKTIELQYTSVDNFGVSVSGIAYFYGRSILFNQQVVSTNFFDPERLGILDAIFHQLVEQGLIDTTIGLDRMHRDNPPTLPVNPAVLIDRINSDLSLMNSINVSIDTVFNEKETWKEVQKIQKDYFNELQKDHMQTSEKLTNKGKLMSSINKEKEIFSAETNGIIVDVVVNKALTKLVENKNFMKRFKQVLRIH